MFFNCFWSYTSFIFLLNAVMTFFSPKAFRWDPDTIMQELPWFTQELPWMNHNHQSLVPTMLWSTTWIPFLHSSLMQELRWMNHSYHHHSLVPTILGSATWILFLHSNLSSAKSSNWLHFISILTISIHVLFSLPLFLEGLQTA